MPNSCRYSFIKRYFTRAPWQSTARLFLECHVLLRPDAAGPAASISRSSLQSARRLVSQSYRGSLPSPTDKGYGSTPRVGTRPPPPNSHDRRSAELLFLEFRGISLGSHGLRSYAQIIGEHCSRNQGKSIALIEVSIKRGYLHVGQKRPSRCMSQSGRSTTRPPFWATHLSLTTPFHESWFRQSGRARCRVREASTSDSHPSGWFSGEQYRVA